jgi:hypothetical protein
MSNIPKNNFLGMFFFAYIWGEITKKLNMKKGYLVLAALSISGFVGAQISNYTQIYRFNPGVKDAPITTIPGQLENTNRGGLETYYSENFDGGFNGWTAAIQNGTVGFKLTSTGHQNSPSNTYQIPPLATSTPTQWILLDSDADGLNGSAEAATFTSPVIDLATAGVTVGTYIQMEFDQFFPEWQNDRCFIGVSNNGGTTWTEKEINIGVGRNARPNPEHITWDITNAVGSDLTNVRIRFRWEGNWDYGWQIDNVKISEIYEKDMTIMGVYRNVDEGLMYSQVPQAHAKPMTIGAILKNIGHVQQTGVGFSYVIKNPSGTTVNSGTANANLALSNADQDTIFWETGFTPSELGSYTVEFTVVSNQGDDDITNNVQEDSYYELTELRYAVDYPLGSKEPIAFWPSPDQSETALDAMFGNLFRFAGTDVVSALEVEIANNPGIIGESIYTIVGYVPPGGTDWLYNGINEFTITADDLGTIKTLPLQGGYSVDNQTLYQFMVGHYGWGDPTDPQNYFMRQGDIMFNNRQGIDWESNGRGFFDRKAPIVRLRVNAAEVGVNELAKAAFAFYPNPADNELFITVSAENENVVFHVRDMAGNLVQTMDLGTVSGGATTSLDVTGFASGMYVVEMVSATGHSVKKFIKK